LRVRVYRGPAAAALLVAAASLTSAWSGSQSQPRASHVVIVTIDGLRWQEFFTGADRDLFKRDRSGSGGDAERRFWRESPEERRVALMPFIWTTIPTRGQIFGDPSGGSSCRLTNGLWFSYPGYNEMFSGRADPRISSNDKVPNPNVTVLEWLNRRPGFEGRVAAFGSWDVLPSILNVERSGLVVGTGWKPVPKPASGREQEINELAADLPRAWSYGPVDAPIVYAALEHVRNRKPRVLYIMLGEGDEWAHQGRYDLYLDATHRADRFIERVWATIQSWHEYAGRTALLVTTDHGRGATAKDWTDHGKDVPAAERTWIVAFGAGVSDLGIRRNVHVTTSQLAATIAELLGEDFRAAAPGAAAPLPLSAR
jgi:hypothetical protein